MQRPLPAPRAVWRGQRRQDVDSVEGPRVEGGIRLLSFKVKKGVLPKHDEVILLALQENLLSWAPGILEYLARYTGLGTSLAQSSKNCSTLWPASASRVASWCTL